MFRRGFGGEIFSLRGGVDEGGGRRESERESARREGPRGVLMTTLSYV
jgi:hypothetical protein